MKIRSGFVSNSSSCSFTCPVCNNRWEGWDWDEPICEKCGINADNVTETFLEYLSHKYEFDIDYERMQFKASQEMGIKEQNRQNYIAEYGREPHD